MVNVMRCSDGMMLLIYSYIHTRAAGVQGSDRGRQDALEALWVRTCHRGRQSPTARCLRQSNLHGPRDRQTDRVGRLHLL